MYTYVAYMHHIGSFRMGASIPSITKALFLPSSHASPFSAPPFPRPFPFLPSLSPLPLSFPPLPNLSPHWEAAPFKQLAKGVYGELPSGVGMEQSYIQPQTIFRRCIHNLCNFTLVLLHFWKLGVSDNNTKYKSGW